MLRSQDPGPRTRIEWRRATMSQITHQLVPYLAGLALIAFLYVPIYNTMAEVKAEMAAIQRGFAEIRAELGSGLGSRKENFVSTPAAEVKAIVASPGSKARRTMDIDKVMKLCVDENCLHLMKNTDAYTIAVDPAAFEQKYCGTEKVIFHMYWNGHMDNRTIMIIRSYLYTQDLQCTRFIVWTLAEEAYNCQTGYSDLPSCTVYDKLGSTWKSHVEFRLLDVPSEIEKMAKFVGVPVNVTYFVESAKQPVGFSDSLRFVLLGNYGGVYMDADVLLLQDLQILFEHDYAYRWSYLDNCNMAVLGLKKGGAVARSMIRDAISNQYKFYSLDSCRYASDRKLPLHILPVRPFDPIWLIQDGVQEKPPGLCVTQFKEAFTKRCPRSTFDGALVYHWHNNYNTAIEEGSYIWSWMTFLEKAVP